MRLKRKRTSWLLAVATVLAVCCLTSGCDDDKPTEPVPGKEYVFYFNDGGYYDRYYRYFSATGIVDSVIIPYGSRSGFAVSADGSRLYLADGASTTVVTSDSFTVIAMLDYPSDGGVAVSPDNQLVAIQGDDGVYILRTSDFSIVHHDTTVVERGVFSNDNTSFYASRWLNGVYKMNVSEASVSVTQKSFSYAVWRVVPSGDETKWFLLVKYNDCLWSFEVYDEPADSISFRDTIRFNGYGDMELSLDGAYLYYTMPGTIEFCPPDPASRLMTFDITNNKIIQRIMIPSPVNGFLLSQNLALTPDGQNFVTDGGPGQGEFVVIDTRTLSVIDYFYLGNQVDIWNVTCQNAP